MTKVNSKNLKIEYPQGLNAENISLLDVNTRDTVDAEEIDVITQHLQSCFSTSSNTLGELLEERKRQVTLLETAISELNQVLTENNIEQSDLVITFEID